MTGDPYSDAHAPTTEAELFAAYLQDPPLGPATGVPVDVHIELRLARSELRAMSLELSAVARELVTIRQLVELLVSVSDVDLDDLVGLDEATS